MANVKIFRINYKSDFILTLVSDAGWMTPFCIKFWTGAPSQAYYVQFDGTTYTHCAPVAGDPTKLTVQFDDHHLPIGNLKYQIAYHFTVADFPNDTEDEVLNQENITTEIDGEEYHVMLDFNGETAPEIQFSLPAYANEAQRIASEEQRISNEQARIEAEQQRIDNEQTRQDNEAQRIAQETARVNEYAELKTNAVAATNAANDAATLANQKAHLAADKAALADAAATLANQKAELAADKAALANQKAAYAKEQGDYAKEQGDYAKEQGDYAKEQGDYAKEQGDYAKEQGDYAKEQGAVAEEDHARAESDHTRAEQDHATATNDHTRAEVDHATASADHTTATNDHTQAVTDHATATSDHTQAGQDHTRAEADHTRAESDHASVEVYVDSLGAFDISSYHATGDVLAKYADLTAALCSNGANIPDALRKGGMSVKFVQSSDNKYVQYRLMSDSFNTTPANWQGVDNKPTAGSDNLVKSGGVFLLGPKTTSNVYDIKPLFGFYRGDLSAGIPNPATENTSKRIYSDLLYSGNKNSITISVSTGCRYGILYYTDSTGSTIKSKSGTGTWRTDIWTVDDDTYFRIYVANATTTESETDITDAYTSINYASILIESKRITIFEEEVNDRFSNDERDIRNLYDITGAISPYLSNGTGNFAVGSSITDKYKDNARVITSVIRRKSGKVYAIKCSGNFDAYIYNIANANKIITYNPGWISGDNAELLISEGDYFRLCFKKSNVTELNPDDITVIVRELDIDYWKSELDTKIAAINTNSGTYTNGVSFAFITDTHIEENIGKSPELLGRVFALTEVDIILHGGDFIVDGNTKSDNIELLNKALKIYENVNSSLMIPTIGNHDLGVVNPMSVPQCERILTNKVRINDLCYSVGNWFTEPSFIANIDTQTKTVVISLGRKVPTSGYFRTEDINYLIRAIDSLEDGAKVILLTHIIWSSGNIAEANTIVLNILDALKNHQAYQNSTYGVNVDYTTAKYANMDVVCVLCGHEHTDGSMVTTGGIPVIRTMADAYHNADKGTTQEQAFDIVQIDYDNTTIYCTRIGKGSNRSFTF